MSKMVEATKHEVTLNNILPEVIELLIEYMYKGKVQIPNKYLLPALEACDYLELLELKARCVIQAPNALNPCNVISWYKLADSLNTDELRTKCSEIIFTSFGDVSKGKEFLELNIDEVSSFISDAQEADCDSDDLLEATTSWVASKPDTRRDHIVDMFEKIDLTRCSTECIDTEMDKHKELLCTKPAALGKLDKSLVQIANQGPSGMRNELGGKAMVVISGQEGENNSHNDCWRLEKSTNFVEFLKLPFSFPWHSVCRIPGGFLVTGGRNNTQCAKFIFSSNSWQQLESLPSSRHGHASIFACGKIYLFGGSELNIRKVWDDWDVLSLDLEGGKWNKEPKIPNLGVHLPKVACVKSNIFLLNSTGQRLCQLDLRTKTWSTKATPPPQLSSIGPRMISVKDRLLVTGGRENICAWYDPTTDAWTTGNPPTIQHYLGALVHHGQKVYLIGGENEDRVEEYDLDTESWSVCSYRLPQKLRNLHAVIV